MTICSTKPVLTLLPRQIDMTVKIYLSEVFVFVICVSLFYQRCSLEEKSKVDQNINVTKYNNRRKRLERSHGQGILRSPGTGESDTYTGSHFPKQGHIFAMVPTIQANKKVWNSVCSTATAFA